MCLVHLRVKVALGSSSDLYPPLTNLLSRTYAGRHQMKDQITVGVKNARVCFTVGLSRVTTLPEGTQVGEGEIRTCSGRPHPAVMRKLHLTAAPWWAGLSWLDARDHRGLQRKAWRPSEGSRLHFSSLIPVAVRNELP